MAWIRYVRAGIDIKRQLRINLSLVRLVRARSTIIPFNLPSRYKGTIGASGIDNPMQSAKMYSRVTRNAITDSRQSAIREACSSREPARAYKRA